MKKLFVVMMAMVAISFSSCGNKTEKSCCEADTCCQDTVKECCGKCPIAEMSEKLEAGDAEGVAAALAQAGEKIEALLSEGKTEEAQKVASAVKEFVEANKEKLAEAQVTTDNIVSTIANLPATVEDAAEAGAEAVKTDAKAAADAAVEAGKAKAEEKANEAVEAGKAKANAAIDDAASAAKKKLGI